MTIIDTVTGNVTWQQLWLPIEGMEKAPAVIVEGTGDSFEEWTEGPGTGEGYIWKDAQMFYTVMAMFDFEADRRGWSLDEVRFQRKEEGQVLAIMKASKGGKKVVAFVRGSSFYDTWREVQETKRREGFDWRPDKYAKF